ncbi:hypothetical protein EON67_09375 [archaeon]|nr:MAG: hypothetical protein EON67_09375 [archaeon]
MVAVAANGWLPRRVRPPLSPRVSAPLILQLRAVSVNNVNTCVHVRAHTQAALPTALVLACSHARHPACKCIARVVSAEPSSHTRTHTR